jgi:hypothetical protein
VIALLLLAFLCCPAGSRAEDACFDEAVAKKMIVVIEQCPMCEQQVSALTTANAELQRHLDLKEGTIKLQKEQIAIQENMIEMLKRTDAAKDKLHAEELKAAKPTFFQTLGQVAAGFAVGVVVAIGVVLLL